MSSRGFRASNFPSVDDISPTQPPTYTLLPEKSTMLLAEVPGRLDTTGFQNPQVHWKMTAQPQDDGSDRDIVAPSPTWRDLYYRVYTQDGAVQSKCAIDSHDTSLGRINANLVAPPHTAASIKRHLCKAEDVADYACTQLFGDTASSEPLDDKALVPILTGAGPGSTPSAPIALVVTTETRSQTISASSSPKTPNPGRRITSPSWLGRTMHRTRSVPQLKKPPPPPERRDSQTSEENTQRSPIASSFKSSNPPCQHNRVNSMVKTKFSAQLSDPAWLSHKKGEILFTDCVQKICGANNEKVIQVRNSKGKVGFIYVNDVIFL